MAQGKRSKRSDTWLKADVAQGKRLSRQEVQEEQEAEAARKDAVAEQHDGASQPVRKQCKALEALTQRPAEERHGFAAVGRRVGVSHRPFAGGGGSSRASYVSTLVMLLEFSTMYSVPKFSAAICCNARAQRFTLRDGTMAR